MKKIIKSKEHGDYLYDIKANDNKSFMIYWSKKSEALIIDSNEKLNVVAALLNGNDIDYEIEELIDKKEQALTSQE